MIRFTSFLLFGLLCGNGLADDKSVNEREAERKELLKQLANQQKRIADLERQLSLKRIKLEIKLSDLVVKNFVRFFPVINNAPKELAKACLSRVVLTGAYFECWLFNSAQLDKAYFEAIRK
jgi:hypothetical protein